METKKQTIEKIKNASNAIEKHTFLDKDVSESHLIQLTFTGHIFRNCNFKNSQLYNINFINCELLHCNFEECLLYDIIFKDSRIIDCNFSKAKLKDVTFEDTFKSENNLTNIEIIGNVNGLDILDGNVISDDTNDKIGTSLTELYPEIEFITDDYRL